MSTLRMSILNSKKELKCIKYKNELMLIKNSLVTLEQRMIHELLGTKVNQSVFNFYLP